MVNWGDIVPPLVESIFTIFEPSLNYPKWYKPEQIVMLLRQIELEIARGKVSPQARKEAEITVQNYYRRLHSPITRKESMIAIHAKSFLPPQPPRHPAIAICGLFTARHHDLLVVLPIRRLPRGSFR
jgi:hypothetical protein